MVEAGALFLGLFAAWILLVQHLSAADLTIAAAASAACVVIVARVSGLDRNSFTRAPWFIGMRALRAGSIFGSAVAIVRVAIGADVKLRPALVRVKTRLIGVTGLAALADGVTAEAGAVVIAIDDDGLLVHVIDEASDGLHDIRQREAQIATAVGERITA